MSKIILGKGTSLEHCATQAGSYTVIPQCTSLTGPGVSAIMINQDHLGSTLSKERPGLINPGTMTLSFWYDMKDTEHMALRMSVYNGTLRYYKLKYVDPDTGTTYETEAFPAYAQNFAPGEAEVGNNVACTVTLRLDDLPTHS